MEDHLPRQPQARGRLRSALAAAASVLACAAPAQTPMEFRLEDAGGRPLSLAADGALTGPQGFWGRLGGDGTVTFADGSVRGRLHEDGRVVDASGALLARIDADGSATVGGLTLRFADDGMLLGASPDQPVRLVAADPRARRVAMLVLVLAQLRPMPGVAPR